MTDVANTWDQIRNTLQATSGMPNWASALLAQTYDVVQGSVGPQNVSLERKTTTRSYLDFLEEQIELEPRGPEWTTILKRRLAALYPHEGRRLLVLMLSNGRDTITARFDEDSFKLIHWETT